MNSDASSVIRLTTSGGNDDIPRWSPSGTKILFQSDRDHPDTGVMDVYVMNADGSGVTRLTFDNNDNGMASWSPDGAKIVFQSMRNGVNYEVYSMNADGSNQVCLSNNSSSDVEPSFSPDGTKVLFASDRDHAGAASIYVMNSDGSNQHALTSTTATTEDRQPVWSPNGAQVVFVSTRDSVTETWQETDEDGNYITKSALHLNKEIYVMNADGSGQTRLTNDAANDDFPTWSPLGLTILFTSDRQRDCCDPTAQIWSMNADGGGQIDLSNDGNVNYSPSSWLSIDSIPTPLAASSPRPAMLANAGGPYMSQTGQVVQLNGSGSYNPNGTITNYVWDFGDGTTGNGAIINHQFAAAGVYAVSLSVSDNNGNSASTQGLVTVDSVAFPVKINFDRLPDNTPIPNNTPIADQYLSAYGVRFSSDNFFAPPHASQNCGFCSTTSLPNFIWTAPNITGQTIVDFTQPASNLSFYIVGLDVFFDQFAVIDVYRNNAPYGSLPVFGNGTATKFISFGGLDNINKIVIRSITDPAGIGFDDFSFTVPADVKITSGRVNGYLNGGTQNALLGADVALNATALPGAFAGGTYSWTCRSASSPNKCAIVTTSNSSSITLRTNELTDSVGNYTVTVNYTKNDLSTSSSFTLKSILPTLTSFTAIQQQPTVWAPFSCVPEEPSATSLWWFRKGCPSQNTAVGIDFHAKVDVPSFISDPTKSGVKYVQAYSGFHKIMSRGIRCVTDRSSESDIASGYRFDGDLNKKIYSDDSFMDFAGLLTSIGIDENDSPGQHLTHFDDWDFVDALYVDDRADMYLVYYSGNDPYNPPIQRPLGRYPWNWGGLVVFDWNGNAAVHTRRSFNPVLISPPSTFAPALADDKTEKPCPDGTPFTDNRIDSSREFVKYHYIDFLGRDPNGEKDADDPTGMTWLYEPDLRGWGFWTSGISQCVFDLNCVRSQRISTGLAFFLSGEFMRNDPIMANGPGTPNFVRQAYNHRFVYWCYFAYLKKFPDQEGWDYWTGVLNDGVDHDNYGHMIDAFQLSDDYRLRRVFQ